MAVAAKECRPIGAPRLPRRGALAEFCRWTGRATASTIPSGEPGTARVLQVDDVMMRKQVAPALPAARSAAVLLAVASASALAVPGDVARLAGIGQHGVRPVPRAGHAACDPDCVGGGSWSLRPGPG